MRVLAGEPRLARLTPQRRRDLLHFVIGNILFVATHELGHGVLAEFALPNLGRDEDAADTFAILTALSIGNRFSDGVLIESAKGWYLTEMQRKKTGEPLVFYDQHGLNLQRAYQIVCLMVGSDPQKFKELAAMAKLPEDRQKSCENDFTAAAWSWETLLKPHRRAPDQPKQHVEVTYGEGKGKLDIYAQTFRKMQMLETLAEHLVDRFAWPRPFVMEMQSCGEVGASWRARKLIICYEMAQEFAEIYRDYGHRLKPKRKTSP